MEVCSINNEKTSENPVSLRNHHLEVAFVQR